ncbi:Reverse transcriptase (RNA-dependent DNA polymerase) [Phytophthora infestans]|uniref:Reverse transcriptase (RNA-dependent DNA polymerase) n=1 Tax=Phytophthora infestans TaxID=4787 RepID=A0A8S9UY07_PHYIN|nr:Reverse transcriptase (RNA-dependent DNA polymerase) [Phytophthora infestans]
MLVIKWLNYTHVYFIKTKDEAVGCFRKFLLMIKNREDSRQIRVLRTDNGGEFINEEFNTLCDEAGLERQISEPDVHYQNGVVERTNRTLIEAARTMLIQAGLPHNLWEYAVRAAAYMRNRVTSRSEPSTMPYAKYHGKMPDLSDSHTFGESVTVLLPPGKRSTLFKFRPVGQRGAFVGHDEQRKGYFVYVREGGARIVNTCDVKFLGSPLKHPRAQYPGVPMIPLQEQFSTTTSGDSMRVRPTDRTSAPTEDDRTRERNAASYTTALVEELNGATDLTRRRRSERISSRNIGAAFLAMTEVIQEPLTLEEARRSPQWSKWEKAIRVEIEALRSNGTFTLVTPPAGAHVIGTTMSFKVKRHADGKVERLRARICAQGFQEIYMIDYIDTYAPVARLVSIRVFLAECNHSGLLIRQGDVPTAFVKANLRELVYVKQPRGFEEGEPGQVWLLRKALYGLKQAGREWYIELDNFAIYWFRTYSRGSVCLQAPNQSPDRTCLCR